MCTYSMIADDFIRKHPYEPTSHPIFTPGYVPDTWPGIPVGIPVGIPAVVPPILPTVPSTVSIQEFEQLKKEVAALKDLLKAAKKFDAETGQPDCEMAEKVDLLRKIARMVGVDLEEVLTK